MEVSISLLAMAFIYLSALFVVIKTTVHIKTTDPNPNEMTDKKGIFWDRENICPKYTG